MKRVVFLILFACLCLVGCKKIEYVSVPQVQIRDSIVTKMQHDSIFIKVTEKQRNDTIYRDSIVYNFVFRNDTIRTIKTDSIPYPVEVEKLVEKKLNSYQRTMIGLGWTLILLIVGYVGYRGVKFYLTKKIIKADKRA